MKKFTTSLVGLLLICFAAKAQSKTEGAVCVAFYNCENFFDTKDDVGVNDEEFLPNGKMKWDAERYATKLEHTAQVIAAFNDEQGADLIGLCEIENRQVLEDLIKQPALKAYKYGIVHHDSPDLRGIDVALLYKKGKFTVESSSWITMHFPNNDSTRTRDVTVVKGHFSKANTTYIFICHFPSRRGGTEESNPRRLFVAKTIRHAVDSIHRVNSEAAIIIMGDLNDEPGDASIQALTHPKDETEEHLLINTMAPLKEKHQGSHYYKGEWSMFDQIIISENLTNNRASVFYEPNSAVCNKFPFLLETEEKYRGQPLRTYVGEKYLGGYSDHLPVNIILNVR